MAMIERYVALAFLTLLRRDAERSEGRALMSGTPHSEYTARLVRINGHISEIMDTSPCLSEVSGRACLSTVSSSERLIFRLRHGAPIVDCRIYRIVVTPSFTHGRRMRVHGPGRRAVRDHVRDVMGEWLNSFTTGGMITELSSWISSESLEPAAAWEAAGGAAPA